MKLALSLRRSAEHGFCVVLTVCRQWMLFFRRHGHVCDVLLQTALLALTSACITSLPCCCSDAHGWQPLPGCAPGQAFVRRLAPQVLPREQLPAGLLERLDRAGLDWQNHPSNTRRVSGRVGVAEGVVVCELVCAAWQVRMYGGGPLHTSLLLWMRSGYAADAAGGS